MKYTATIGDHHARPLLELIFSKKGVEGAAYLLCGVSTTETETRLLVRDVVPVRDDEYLVREPLRLSIDSSSYARVVKTANTMKCSVIFVHSHPEGIADFSEQDDREEPKLMTFFGDRAAGRLHGSIVVSGPVSMHGRVWIDGQWVPLDRIRILGRRYQFLDPKVGTPAPRFDRQVEAFGSELQGLLQELHIGVVGCGGTGSAVAEQLCRLGVGKLSLFDGDALEKSNVTRVYGSTIADAGSNKALVLGQRLSAIGLGTEVRAFGDFISVQTVAKQLRDCDIVFGCTDAQAPRGLLVKLALRHLIPVFDIGVKITAPERTITDITGRVTELFPGNACLFCRERITAERIAFESLSADEKAARVREGYAPALRERDPAVIMFTTGVAVQAVEELLHRISGFMGADRNSTEVLMRFHVGHTGKNSQPPAADCMCSDRDGWGRGDAKSFLDVSWTA